MRPNPGFTRDKTKLFSTFRAQSTRNRPGGDGPAVAADSSLVQMATGIESRFAEVESKIAELKQVYDDRFRTLTSFTDERQAEARVGALTTAISQLLGVLRDEVRHEVSRGGSERRRMLETNLQHGHAARLRNLTLQFREMQQDYVRRLRTFNQGADVMGSMANQGDDFNLENFNDIGFTDQQQNMVVQNELANQQRLREFREMSQMMNTVQELFRDLGTLIMEQGTMLDRIDGNIMEAINEIDEGNRQLEKAEEHQKKGNKCFYWYLIAVVVAILIVGSVILIRKGKKGSSGGDSEPTPAPTPMATPTPAAAAMLLGLFGAFQ